MSDHGPADEARALDEAAEREEEEARTLAMLADADERAPQTAGIAASDRAVGTELEMEAEFLRKKAAEGPDSPGSSVAARAPQKARA